MNTNSVHPKGDRDILHRDPLGVGFSALLILLFLFFSLALVFQIF